MLPLRDYPFDTRPMIIAHRGDTTHGARENSIEAILAAVASGADMVEVDVQWSADEVFVCYHDFRVASDDGASASAKRVSDLLFSELRERGIASLEEIIRATASNESSPDRTIYFNIEVKEYSSCDPRRFMQALTDLITTLGMKEYVLISSFRIDFISAAGWEIPTVIIHPDEEMQRFFDEHSYRANDSSSSPVLEKPLDNYLPSELLKLAHATSYACQLSELTEERRRDIARYNILLSVYTIESEPEFHHALLSGARAVVCERPSEFVLLRNNLFP